MIFLSICHNIPPQMNILNMLNPHSNAFLQFPIKLEHCKPHKAAHHSTTCDIINDIKNYLFFDIIQQMSHNKIKCTRVQSEGQL